MLQGHQSDQQSLKRHQRSSESPKCFSLVSTNANRKVPVVREDLKDFLAKPNGERLKCVFGVGYAI